MLQIILNQGRRILNFYIILRNSLLSFLIHGTISIQRKFWKRQEDNMTNRKRGQLDELCMDRYTDAPPASHSDDLEDVEKRLERCTGKDRKSSDHRLAGLHRCVPVGRCADLAGLSYGIY